LPPKQTLACLSLLALWAAPAQLRAEDWGARSGEEIPSRPPLPAITELRVEPASLRLVEARDGRRLLVAGRSADGAWLDLTWGARITAETSNLRVDEEGFVYPRAAGPGRLAVAAAGLSASVDVTVDGAEAPPIRFVREVMPIISKVGCNAGTCHGANRGRNGFKLSLRGYDPEADYQALVHDLSGRRFNRAAPDQSLMLLKTTATIPHEGGQPLVPNGRYHAILRRWIAEGARPEAASERVQRLQVLPATADLALPGMTRQLLVLAHYPDGSTRDVTREAIYAVNKTDVAAVDERGEVIALRRGEAAVLIRYEGAYATKSLAVMGDRTGFAWAAAEEHNFIDRRVNAKLERMKIQPAATCSDADFIRRASLDLTGLPPTPERTRAFLQDPTPSREKRARLVEALLGTEDYVEHWTNKWADLLQCSSTALGEKGVWVFRNWIREAVATNLRYDEFVRALITAEGSGFAHPPANFYRALREPEKAAEDVTQLFLGTRFACAKCHDHPFERWTQNQYYQLGAYFSRLALKKGRQPGEEIVYARYDDPAYPHPKTGRDVSPAVPFGEAAAGPEDAARREAFARWLTSAENPLFARAIANRIWSYFFGRGIIEPVDDIRSSNPPLNPELLDALTEALVESGFDLQRLMRLICDSQTYQRSVETNRWNEDDVENFARALPRRLSAEQLFDAIALAAGTQPAFENLPEGLRAAAVPDRRAADSKFLELFGKPERKSVCECERTSNLTLSHAMNLINGRTINAAVSDPNGRFARLAREETDDRKVVEEIYLAVLARPPEPEELKTAGELPEGENRVAAAQDLAWALMNSPAFLFNR